MFCSKRWAASTAPQYASLASLRAWSCGSSFLPWVWQWNSVWWLGHRIVQQLPVDLLPAWQHPTSAMSALPKKHRFPSQGLPSVLVHMVWGPLLLIYLIVYPLDLFLCGLESHHLDGQCFHLSILPRDQLLVASIDESFLFFLPCLFGTCKHPLHDVRMLWAVCSPPRLFIKKELGIQVAIHLSY